jgi:hypothetical protein
MENFTSERDGKPENEIKRLKEEITEERREIRQQEKKLQELEHEKLEVLIVNAESKPWHEHTISYKEVIILAFGIYEDNPDISYNISYSHGIEKKPEGILDKGQTVKVKNKERFDVTKSNRS